MYNNKSSPASKIDYLIGGGGGGPMTLGKGQNVSLRK